MQYKIIDIETIPDDTCDKPIFDESTIKFGNVKDELKRQDKIDKERESFELGMTKKMSISSNYCRIVSLAWITTDEAFVEIDRGVILGEANDIEILKKFKEIMVSLENTKIIGWNSKNFDIPILWKRGILNKIKVLKNHQSLTAPYRDDSIDLMHVWNGYGNYGKLIDCSKRLGIEAKSGMDGSMIYDAFKNKEFDKIKDYNTQDVESNLAIAKKIL